MKQHPKRQASYQRLASGLVSNRRSDILLAATDTFCNQDRPDKKQIEQYRELFYSLIGESTETSKRLIGSALSSHPYTPRPLLLYLALESAAVAAPVLAYAKSFSQFDILQIIDKTSNLHHRVIANRNDLGEAVIEKLLELNDPMVLRRLQDSSIEKLNMVRASMASFDELVEPESHPAPIVEKAPSVSVKPVTTPMPAAPARKEEQYPVDEKAQTRVKAALDELISLANRGKRLAVTETAIENKSEHNQKSLGKILLDATIRKNRQDQIIALQQHFGLSAKTAGILFEDHSGDSLAVSLKAAGLENGMALQIIAQALPNVGLSEHNTRRMAKVYPALDEKICRTTVEKWSREDNRETYKPATTETSFTDNRALPEGRPFGRRQTPQKQRDATENLTRFGTR